jgi:hypothetical protein
VKEKDQVWVDTRDRFVAFLDIMGFKERVNRDSHDTIYKDLLSFFEPVEDIEKFAQFRIGIGNVAFSGFEPAPSPVSRAVAFSDSIIIFSGDNTIMSLFILLDQVQKVLDHAMSRNIPLKGAIAFGHQTADFIHSIFFGKPLIDAYELQDQILIYSVVLHHTVEQRMIDLGCNPDGYNIYYTQFNTPIKKGVVNHYLLRWNDNEDIATDLKNLQRIVSGKERCYVDNTLHYFNWLKQKPLKNH